MKNLLHTCLLSAGIVSACVGAQPVFAADKAEEAIDYAGYSAIFQGSDYMTDAVIIPLEPIGDNTYRSVTPIAFEKDGSFAIQNADGSMYFGAPMGVAVTEDNLSLTLTFFDGDIMKWYEDIDNLPVPVAVDVEGEYDFTVVYGGEHADIVFSPVDPSKVGMSMEGRLKVGTADRLLTVSGLQAGEEVMVCDMNGHILCVRTAASPAMELTLDKGIYMVRAGKVTSKVIVR